MKGLTVEVFRSSLSSCTNGPSATANHLTITAVLDLLRFEQQLKFAEIEKTSRVFEPTPSAPEFWLVREFRAGALNPWNQYLIPAGDPKDLKHPRGEGWMFGGNLAASSDSRFSELVRADAVRIHDRKEW